MSATTQANAAAHRRSALGPTRAILGRERRAALLRALETSAVVPGDELAGRFGVSRQAIVHDVAILRAAGSPIVATVRGYLLAPTVEHARSVWPFDTGPKTPSTSSTRSSTSAFGSST